MEKNNTLLLLCASISMILLSFSFIGPLPEVSAAGSWENVCSISKTIEIPPGESYFAYFDRDSGTIVEMMLPSLEAGLSQNAKDALTQVPNWLYEDMAKKFAELGDTNIDVGDFATPVFADMDGDADLDLTVGSEAGIISYYENVGTKYRCVFVEEPTMYEWVNSNLADSLARTSVAIADLDGDDDNDLIIGESEGTLYYLENVGDATFASWSSYSQLESQGNPIDIGENSHPALADLDVDDDFDLVIGAEDGNFYYYENTGTTTNPEWTDYIIDPFDDLDLNQGNSKPAFADMDDDNDLDMSSGESQGVLHYFRNIGSETSPAFMQDDSMFLGITVSYATAPTLSDIDGDYCYELTVGVNTGVLYFYENIGSASDADWLIWSSYQVGEGYMYYPKDVFLNYRAEYHMDRYADLILNAAQKYKDEIGFAIAHTPTENLKAMNNNQIQLFVDNAELIYEIDRYLDYVEVIEKEDYTTTRYKFGEPGNTVDRELPKDIYYWYIVHPKITDENVFYIHPNDSNPNHPTDPVDGGRFWREYLFYHADESYPSDNSGAPDDGVDDYPIPEVRPPLLKGLLEGVEVLFNGTTWHAPGGNYSSFQYTGEDNRRPFTYGDHAVIRVSNWVGKTLILNQQEVSDGERPIQPVRIAHHHNGNCGELQDLTTASARTALIPAAGVLLLGEDHVWIEFYENGWHQWDNYWSDAGSVIDNWNNYWVGWGERGGSGIFKEGGDDDTWEVTDHYIPEDHLNYVTIRVMDNNGDPIDGARVLVLSYWLTVTIEGYQVDIPFPCIWNYTDANGETLFKLATQERPNGNRNFTFRIISKVGSTESGKRELEHGENYTFSFNLEGSAPNPELNTNQQPNPNPPNPEYRLGFSYQVTNGYQHPRNLLTGNYHPEELPPERLPDTGMSDFDGNHIDSFITTEPEWVDFIKGNGFDSYEYAENSNSDAFEFDLPDEDEWYIVLSNRDSIETTKVVDLTLDLYFDPPPYSVKIIVPIDGSYVNIGGIITISGIVTNESELDSLQISVDNGENWESVGWSGDHWAYDWDTSSVTPGNYPIEVNAMFDSPTSASIEIELLDMEPPSIEILTPSEYSQINIGSTLTIEGTATDNFEIISLQFSIDGGNNWTNILSGLHDGQWSYDWITAGLSFDYYVIQILASDGVNHRLVSSWEPIELLDLEPPSISISDPTEDSIVNVGTPFTITGTASDNIEVVSLQLSTDGGENWTDILSNLNDNNVWTYGWNTAGLPFGVRSLMVNASDGIYYTTFGIDIELADIERPLISIAYPHENSQVNIGSMITISGNATDNLAIQELELRTQKGSSWEDILPSLNNGRWSYDWDTKGLDLGNYIIELKASDGTYLETESVEFELADLEPPKVEITSPAQNDDFNCGEIITVIGTAVDNMDITELKVSTDNGINWVDILPSLNHGNWEYNWHTNGLIGGVYTITIVTSDDVNPPELLTLDINLLDGEMPVLEIISPEDDSTYNIGTAVTITGTASDNVRISGLWISTDDANTWINILPSLTHGQWQYEWNTNELEAGVYYIRIKVSDGTYEVEDSVTVVFIENVGTDTENGKGDISPRLTQLLALMVIAIIIAVVIALILYKRQYKKKDLVEFHEESI